MVFAKDGIGYILFFQHVEQNIFVACQNKDLMPLLLEDLHDVFELVVVLWVVEFKNVFHGETVLIV